MKFEEVNYPVFVRIEPKDSSVWCVSARDVQSSIKNRIPEFAEYVCGLKLGETYSYKLEFSDKDKEKEFEKLYNDYCKRKGETLNRWGTTE